MSERRRFRRDAIPASDLIARKLRSIGPPPAASALEEAQRKWPDVAGALGRDARPIGVTRSGILTVACASAGLAQRLSADTETLVEALEIGQVRTIRFVVSSAPTGEGTVTVSGGPPAPVAAPKPRHRVAAREATKGVSDPALRRLLERAAATSFARADSPANTRKHRGSRDRG